MSAGSGPLLLQIRDLRAYFYSRSKQAFIRAVDGVDLAVFKGSTLGIVGESGSGKSITMLSSIGLVTGGPGVITGSVIYQDGDKTVNLLNGLPDYVYLEINDGRIMAVHKQQPGWESQVRKNLRPYRGKDIAMIFQNPKAAMHPFQTVGQQIMEVVRLHTEVKDKTEARQVALNWLDRVRMDSPKLRFDNHPHGLSGGMCQRAMIAMALAAQPSLLIADEPTTGLDATIQSKIVDLLLELRQDLGITTILISHDISVIKRLSDDVAVMYGGRVMETGPAALVLDERNEERHPYTQALLASTPRRANANRQGYLPAIKGEVCDNINVPDGCRFFSRCQMMNDRIRERCQRQEPDLVVIAPGHRVRCWLHQEDQ